MNLNGYFEIRMIARLPFKEVKFNVLDFLSSRMILDDFDAISYCVNVPKFHYSTPRILAQFDMFYHGFIKEVTLFGFIILRTFKK